MIINDNFGLVENSPIKKDRNGHMVSLNFGCNGNITEETIFV